MATPSDATADGARRVHSQATSPSPSFCKLPVMKTVLRLTPPNLVAAAFCMPMASASSGGAELQQGARQQHAPQERGDDRAIERGAEEMRARQPDAEQDGIAGHEAGKGVEAQEADRVGISRDDRKHAGLWHSGRSPLAGP